jgi:serine/threonine protein kinase
VNAEGNKISSKHVAKKAINNNSRLGTYKILNDPYTRKFKANNADIEQIAKTNGNPCRIKEGNTNIGVIRMPNLGVDIYRVYDAFVNGSNPDLLHVIQGLSLLDLLEKGVKPVFVAVQALRRNRMLHMDIKMENIMIQPSTGEMRIIDYDLMGPDMNIIRLKLGDEHLVNYPPESILWRKETVTDESYDAWFNQMRTIDEIFVVDGRPLGYATLQKIIADIVSTPEDNKKILEEYLAKSSDKPNMMYRSVDTLDSYCTAVSLLIFFCVYLNCKDNWPKYSIYLNPLLGGILTPMMMFKIEDRISIDVAIARVNALLRAMKAAAAAAAAGLTTPKSKRNSKSPLVIPRTPVKQSRSNFLKSIGRREKREPSVAGGTRKKLKSVRRTKKGRRRA